MHIVHSSGSAHLEGIRTVSRRQRSSRSEAVLRKRLQEMTESRNVSRHRELLTAIARACPHTVKILTSERPIRSYTCLMHVFGFDGHRDNAAIARRCNGRVFAGANYAHWLIDNSELEEIDPMRIRAGDLAMYFNDGVFKHVGLIGGNDRLVSKWGIGNLYDHRTFEVPESYGSEVRYYRRLTVADAFQLFVAFARRETEFAR